MELKDLRNEIDEIDKELVALFAKRMSCAASVAEYKRAHSLPILDKERENALLKKVSSLSGEELAPYTRGLYEKIMELSRAYQRKLRAEERDYSYLNCGLIGEKLGHSFSVPIHNRLANYSFVLREVEKEKLGDFLRSDELDAFCVTIPYKKDVIPYLEYVSPEAESIGAVNVVVRREGNKLYGYNTDYFGFEYMISSAGVDVKGKKAVVFGNGGASLTVCAVLRDKGIGKLVVIRSADNTPENLKKHSDAEIIVNATPVGMYPNNDASPADLELFPNCKAVLDLIYNPANTRLMQQALKRGIVAVGGLSMLVAQAAKGFEHFTGDPYEEGRIERIIDSIYRWSQNIILIGMPGSGKSSIGTLLAKEYGKDFFDADEEFSRMHGMTPANAITKLGEEVFRDMESEVLCELGKKSGAVIATGGGAVTRERNYAYLHQNGVILLIERELDKLAVDGRPLSQGNSLHDLYEKRKGFYDAFADLRISNSSTPEAALAAARQALDSYDYVKRS